MKRFLILSVLYTLCIAHSLAQKIEYKQYQGGVYLFRAGAFETKLGDTFEFCIDMLTDLNRKQYFIVARSEQNKVHNFPPDSKLLLKLCDDTTLELSSCYHLFYTPKELSIIPMAWFPISAEQLQSLIGTGVAKVRIELISVNEKDKSIMADNQDAVFKKDKLGASFKKMLEEIDKELAMLGQQIDNMQRKDVSVDF